MMLMLSFYFSSSYFILLNLSLWKLQNYEFANKKGKRNYIFFFVFRMVPMVPMVLFYSSIHTKQDIARFISNFIIMTYRRSFTLACHTLALCRSIFPIFIHSFIRFATVVPFPLNFVKVFHTRSHTTARVRTHTRTTPNSLKKKFSFYHCVAAAVVGWIYWNWFYIPLSFHEKKKRKITRKRQLVLCQISY